MGGKVAVVTAGGSGMGAAAARRLAADGFEVAVLSSSGKGEALARELGGLGVTGSNQSTQDLKRLVDGTMQIVDPPLERHGEVDDVGVLAAEDRQLPAAKRTDAPPARKRHEERQNGDRARRDCHS